MRRTIDIATLLLACAVLAPACLLNSGAYETTGGGGPVGPGGGGTGGTGAGGGNGGTGGTPANCGNSAVEAGEQCDDANEGNGDGCTSTCTIEPGYACENMPSECKKTCGNGQLDGGGEDCDDFDTETGDGCNQGCQVEVGWECDNPNGSASPSVCKRSCGNGTVDVGETCDPGLLPQTGCDANCKIVDGWECTGAPSTCTAKCGDGMIVDTEVCDDGGTGCNADCTGPVTGWTCNDMGGADSCKVECGDGLFLAGEECDDGNESPNDGCSAACKLEAACGNGIIEPGEACDGGGDCKPGCVIDPTKICGKATAIPSAAPDDQGVIVTMFEGDTKVQQNGTGDVLNASCFAVIKPKLHVYTTGNRGSIVTLETKSGTVGGVATFSDTVLWAYRDCLNKAVEEGCNNDINPSQAKTYSRFTTGYLPPKTTLYVVVGGYDNSNEGKFIIEVTEQPVRLKFAQTFNADMSGLTSTDVGDDGKKWAFCDAGGCGPNSTKSASGKGYALADDTGNLDGEILQTDPIAIGPLQNVFVQYNVNFDEHAAATNDSLTCTASNDGSNWSTLYYKNVNDVSRQIHDVSAAGMNASDYILRFTYSDGGGDVHSAKVDDVYVYGY